jgi:hypothetical protein
MPGLIDEILMVNAYRILTAEAKKLLIITDI